MMPGVDLREFRDALARAFSPQELYQLVRINLDEHAAANINWMQPIAQVTFDLIEWAEHEGEPVVVELARAVYLERPRNEKIKRIYEKFGMAPAVSCQIAGVTVAGAPRQATASQLEAIVSPRLKAVDMGVWQDKMARIEGQVCRIELNGNARGTGFLVGPDLVLTNYHVLESLIVGATPPSQIACRFDYKALSDGSRSEGIVARLSDVNWRVDASRYSQAEADGQPDRELPTLDELDYALVRLARPVGDAPIGKSAGPDATRRGWIQFPEGAPALEAGQPLLIAQHPDGSPLKLALDTQGVLGLNANGTRVRYATNTDHGSSGSPCFDMEWNLIALHHMGDPAWLQPKFNEGIPIGSIRKRLAGKIELQKP
jgi:hypothetical protein